MEVAALSGLLTPARIGAANYTSGTKHRSPCSTSRKRAAIGVLETLAREHARRAGPQSTAAVAAENERVRARSGRSTAARAAP